jgi:hypothetical protein
VSSFSKGAGDEAYTAFFNAFDQACIADAGYCIPGAAGIQHVVRIAASATGTLRDDLWRPANGSKAASNRLERVVNLVPETQDYG